jgi:hypothetical protein
MRRKPAGGIHEQRAANTQSSEFEPSSELAEAEAQALAALEAQPTNVLPGAHLTRGLAPAQQDADWEQDATCHYPRLALAQSLPRAANSNQPTRMRGVRSPPSAAQVARDWEEEPITTHFSRALAPASAGLSELIELSSLLEPDEDPSAADGLWSNYEAVARESARGNAQPERRRPELPLGKRPAAHANPSAVPVAQRAPAQATRRAVATHRHTPASDERVPAQASLAPELRQGVEAQERTSLRPGRSPWLWSLSAALPICIVLVAYVLWGARSPHAVGTASDVLAPALSVAAQPTAAAQVPTIQRDAKSGEPSAAEAAPATEPPTSIEPALALEPAPALEPTLGLELASAIAPVVSALGPSTARARRGHPRAGYGVRHTRRITPLVESSTEAAAEAQASPSLPGSGTLQINSRPWARIWVDGGFVGNTPQRALQLHAGHHTVRLVNETFAMSKTIDVTIAPGHTLKRVEVLDEDAAASAR